MPEAQTSPDLRFVHLSDIHFRRGLTNTKHDPDREIRQELDYDLRRLATTMAPFSGIIITGDIAWGGQKQEYEIATTWIRSMAEELRCSLSNVMLVPGNHDVFRAVLKRNGGRINKLHQRLRRGGKSAICAARLDGLLSKPDGRQLTTAIASYNAFAEQFNCKVSHELPYWERDFPLGDGSTLRVRGITSTWLSGPSDSEVSLRLLYGSAQYTFEAAAGTHFVVAGHHPPVNMIDGETASHAFDFHCRLQLFGHKHSLWITPGATGAKIIAGALQPNRLEEPWIPRYNVIDFAGHTTAAGHSIDVTVYPRRWSEEFRRFMPDYTPAAEDFRRYPFNVA
jgi:hypothetical protein